MSTWLRRIRASLTMGVLWAAGWGFVGGLIELADNVIPGLTIFDSVDMWIQTLAIPGFLGGALFATALSLGDGRRRFAELSLPRIAVWGALGGVALGALGLSLGLGRSALGAFWLRTVVVMTPLTVLCSASAVATLALARAAKDGPALRSGDDRSLPRP
jgi:hypothetical protein